MRIVRSCPFAGPARSRLVSGKSESRRIERQGERKSAAPGRLPSAPVARRGELDVIHSIVSSVVMREEGGELDRARPMPDGRGSERAVDPNTTIATGVKGRREARALASAPRNAQVDENATVLARFDKARASARRLPNPQKR